MNLKSLNGSKVEKYIHPIIDRLAVGLTVFFIHSEVTIRREIWVPFLHRSLIIDGRDHLSKIAEVGQWPFCIIKLGLLIFTLFQVDGWRARTPSYSSRELKSGRQGHVTLTPRPTKLEFQFDFFGFLPRRCDCGKDLVWLLIIEM